jgi:uncharacterized membrane protein
MNNALAIIIGSVIIAAAILIVFRWQLGGPEPIMLLDRWTGTVIHCIPIGSPPAKINCELR